MRLLIIGGRLVEQEFRERFGSHELLFFDEIPADSQLTLADYVFFLSDLLTPESFARLAVVTNKPVLIHSVAFRLGALVNQSVRSSALFCGACFFPGFIARSIWEVSLHKNEHRQQVLQQLEPLDIRALVCDDRVGLISPRVICMIINEAYYTVMEGTASKADIDTGMKLGTNYPMGPFEWCKKIGISNVYHLLGALYTDTGDERYKICPLLKSEFLAQPK